jgi:tetratricopeptide (TPR) repeat protein
MRYAALYAAKDLTLSGKYQEAADALRVADKAEPYYAPTFYQLALVFAGAGDMGEAQGALQRAFGLKGQMSPLDPRLPDPSKDPAFSKWAGDKAWNDFLAGLPR